MSLKELWQYLARKKTLLLILWVIFFIISVPVLVMNQKTEYKTYVYFTVAPKEYVFNEVQQPEINSFYLISASDIFAETIVGWFKDPNFLNTVEKRAAELKPNTEPLPKLNARKETRQNVIIFFSTTSQSANAVIGDVLIEAIKAYVDDYNKNTNTTFNLANLSQTTMTIDPQLLKDIGIAVVGALLLALLATLVPLLVRKNSR